MKNPTIKELSDWPLKNLIELSKTDSRTGILSLIAKKQRVQNQLEELVNEFNRMDEIEKVLRNTYSFIAGMDEVGRGPLAGPVVTAMVILDPTKPIYGLRDSKKLSKKQRESLALEIRDKAICYHIHQESNRVIDEINILEATKLSMVKTLEEASIKPDIVLIDALELPISIPQKGIIKGDDTCNSIAAASIIAKVFRDELMIEMSSIYPQYDFHSNKGYGSAKHIEAIRKYGCCPIHRQSFIKNFT